MSDQAPVVNFPGDYEESVTQLAKHLGRDKNRRAVFNLIYGRGSKPRSKKQIAEILDSTGSGQIVQNSLDHLAKYHLISRIENKSQVKDGSRWVYAKNASVRAHRKAILRYADNPAAAKKVPTKRRPDIGPISFVQPSARKAEKATKSVGRGRKNAKLKIALLVTNPDRRASLQTGVEARYIRDGILLSGRSADIDINVVFAPTLDTLLDTLNTYKADVIHFSGHGGDQALLFDNERAGDDGGTVLDFDMIARLIEATKAIPKLLVLVACNTVSGAHRFLDKIPAVIAMADAVDDTAACDFSKRFYRSLSSGGSISESLAQAKIALEAQKYKDADLPTLLAKTDDAKNYSFL